MYQAPDLVKVEITVKNSFSGTHCSPDEGTDYTITYTGQICTDGGEDPTQWGNTTYPAKFEMTYQCYSTRDE